jgi:hypothetical protein
VHDNEAATLTKSERLLLLAVLLVPSHAEFLLLKPIDFDRLDTILDYFAPTEVAG